MEHFPGELADVAEVRDLPGFDLDGNRDAFDAHALLLRHYEQKRRKGFQMIRISSYPTGKARPSFPVTVSVTASPEDAPQWAEHRRTLVQRIAAAIADKLGDPKSAFRWWRRAHDEAPDEQTLADCIIANG